jgi:hypothetical protein
MSLVAKGLFWISPKKTIHGLPSAAFHARAQRAAAFAKLQSAFDCIQQHAPVRYAQVTRDLACVLVAGAPWARGSFHQATRTCELYSEWLLDPETPPEAVAATLIHEAQHARLHRLGFGYPPEIRERIERLCHRAARNFARTVGNCEWLVDELTRQLARDPQIYSPAGRWEAKAAALDSISVPAWIKVPLKGYLQWRGRRSGRDPAAS